MTKKPTIGAVCINRECDHAGEKQPYSEFYDRVSAISGKSGECKSCMRKRIREYTKTRERDRKDFYKMIFG